MFWLLKHSDKPKKLSGELGRSTLLWMEGCSLCPRATVPRWILFRFLTELFKINICVHVQYILSYWRFNWKSIRKYIFVRKKYGISIVFFDLRVLVKLQFPHPEWNLDFAQNKLAGTLSIVSVSVSVFFYIIKNAYTFCYQISIFEYRYYRNIEVIFSDFWISK